MRHLMAGIFFVRLCLAGLPAVGGEIETPLLVGDVAIKADSISRDEEKDIFQAQGNVEVKWDGFTLTSDSALVRKGDNEAIVEGNVSLLKEGIEFKSERIKVNYVTQRGEAENGSLFITQRNFHVRGKRFLKTGSDEYHLERGTFTTCDGDSPSWKFAVSDLDVQVEEYATGRNAVFYVGDMPLFYTPYILFPVKRERQSGFLFSRFGSSTKKGFNIDIPYYWAISPSQEVTLDLDAQTKRGAGIGFDYNYLRPHESNGEFKGYLIYDIQKEWMRGYMTLKQQEFLSPSLALASNLNLALDRDFYRDYGETSGEYNRQLLDSTIFLTKNWAQSSLAVETRYVDDLDATTNRETLQKLPSITFTRTRSPIGATPIYFGLDTNFTDFYRVDGIRGQRFDLHPLLAYYYTISPGLDFSAWGGYRQRIYNGYGADEGRGYHGDGLFDGGASLSAPLAKVYGPAKGDMLAVRHTFIPELRYSLVQEKNQERLPFFNYDDRILGQQILSWSLTNFVTGKYADAAGPPVYRDIFYFRLSQGYQLSGNRRDLLTLADEGRQFTDVRLEARYALAKLFTANADVRYNPYMTRISTASLRFDLDNGRGDLAGLGYQFARNQVQYLYGKLMLSLVKPFVFNYTCRYSFDKENFIESNYSIEYKRQCWSVNLSYQDRPDNKQFMLSFTLAGVGSFGPLKTF